MKNKNYYYSLIFGVLMMSFTIDKFSKISKTTTFKSPFFKVNKSTFYNLLNIDEINLKNYKKILVYDNYFAFFYSTVFYSINKLNNNFLDNIIKSTIPLHIILDLLENYVLQLIINNFIKNKKVKNNKLFFGISAIKWSLALFHSSISIYSIYKIIK